MKLPNWLRAGLMTGAFVAVPGLLAALIDVVDDVASWAAGESLNLPDLSTVRSAFVAVVAGAIAGGLNAAWRYVQERRGLGTPPVYPTTRNPQQ